MNNKLDEFHTIITEENPDVVGVTETWGNANNFDSEYNVNDNYIVFRKDRKTNTIGGGVLLLVRKTLSVTETKYPEDNGIVETLWCDIKTGKNKVLKVGVCYTPRRNEDADIKIAKEFEWACKSEVIIMGDFNYAGIDWETSNGSNKDDSKFIETLRDNYLYQHVREATRGNKVLDLVLSQTENDVVSIEASHSLGKSDHRILTWDYVVSTERKENAIKVPDFRKAKFDELRCLIREVNWDVLNSLNAEEAWVKFKSVIHNFMETCVPVKQFRKIDKPMWMSNDILQGTKAKKRKWRKLKQKGCKCLNEPHVNSKGHYCVAFKKFKELEKEVQKKIRIGKARFEEDIALDIKLNPKKFYSYVRSKNKSKEGIGPLLSDDKQLVESDVEMVQILNNFFSSVFTTEDMLNVPNETMPGNIEMGNISCTLSEITKGLLKLNVNKSCGPDRLYPRILKELANEIAKPLQIIFNKTLWEGKVPQDWKVANVTPIFKKGSRNLRGNYRPVSLTSVVCRVLESIIREHVSAYLNKNRLIKDSQHGFSKGKSCQTNLLTFFERITNEVDKNNELDVVYLDFAKAFDKVPHHRLGLKLKSLGIKGNVFKWIEDWLTNRQQRVVVNGTESPWAAVTSGVPQGSVLGPLLFLVYINDIDEGVSSLISKFADDTKIGRPISDKDDITKLQKDLDLLGKWAEKWQMKFNADKCKVIHFGGDSTSNYVMDGKRLENIHEEKDLGVLIHKTLKPEKQCQAAAGRANRVLGMLKRNITSRKKEVILPLYRTLVRPHLEYGVQFWNPYLVKDIKLLENVQRRATRMVGELKGLSYEDRLKECNLFSLSRRRLRGDMIQVFKILKGIDKVEIKELGWEVNERETRGHSLKLVKHYSRLDLRKNYFTQRVVDYWNKLPSDVVSVSTVESFKVKIDKFMNKDGIV